MLGGGIRVPGHQPVLGQVLERGDAQLRPQHRVGDSSASWCSSAARSCCPMLRSTQPLKFVPLAMNLGTCRRSTSAVYAANALSAAAGRPASACA